MAAFLPASNEPAAYEQRKMSANIILIIFLLFVRKLFLFEKIFKLFNSTFEILNINSWSVYDLKMINIEFP